VVIIHQEKWDRELSKMFLFMPTDDTYFMQYLFLIRYKKLNMVICLEKRNKYDFKHFNTKRESLKLAVYKQKWGNKDFNKPNSTKKKIKE
jgi:hypothetical protein